MARRAIESGILRLPEGDESELRLAGSRCVACGTVFHPARSVCLACHSRDLRDIGLLGRGTLYACTHVAVPLRPGMRERHGYWVGQVDLDDGPRIQGLLAPELSEPRIGMRVRLGLETLKVADDGDETVVHHFRADESAEAAS